MKLLFDQNLSHRLVAALADVFPGSVHVRDVGLARAADDALWAQARDAGFTIASKDSDFVAPQAPRLRHRTLRA
jgi:predicted nuclease of predicted toxin-antitoxin system